MDAVIEQDHRDFSKLYLICRELGIGYRDPAAIGGERFCAAMEQLQSLECKTGFGDFRLIKRENGRWVAEKRRGEKVFHISVGKAQNMTSAALDDAAVYLYGPNNA